MRVTVSDLFDGISKPLSRLHGSKTVGVVFVQETRLTKVFQHACFSLEDSGHNLANEKHDPHVCVLTDPINQNSD